MDQNNFFLNLIASLSKGQSKKQIRTDIKNLGEIKIPLIGTLNKAKTKSQIKQDLASINGEIKISGKVDKKSLNAQIQQSTQQAQKKAKSQPIQLSLIHI